MMESQKVCGKVELKDNFSAKTLETHAQFYFLNSMHFPSTSHVHGFQNFFFFLAPKCTYHLLTPFPWMFWSALILKLAEDTEVWVGETSVYDKGVQHYCLQALSHGSKMRWRECCLGEAVPRRVAGRAASHISFSSKCTLWKTNRCFQSP